MQPASNPQAWLIFCCHDVVQPFINIHAHKRGVDFNNIVYDFLSDSGRALFVVINYRYTIVTIGFWTGKQKCRQFAIWILQFCKVPSLVSPYKAG